MMNQFLKLFGNIIFYTFLFTISFIASFLVYMNLIVRGGNPCCNHFGGYFLLIGPVIGVLGFFLKGRLRKIIWYVAFLCIMIFLSSIFAQTFYSCLCEEYLR